MTPSFARSRGGITIGRAVCAGLLWLWSSPLAAGPPATVELQTNAGVWQGRSLAHDQQACWLMETTGELREIRLAEVTALRRVNDQFRPATLVEMRDLWRKECPPGMEVAVKGRYVVVGPKGQAAACATLLDEVYNDFWQHFSRRGFSLQPPEFPLVAIVFPSRQQFVAYATGDYPQVSPHLRGYYNRKSNRIACYLDASLSVSEIPARDGPHDRAIALLSREPLGSKWDLMSPPGMACLDAAGSASEIPFSPPLTSPDRFATIEAGIRETLIHEATHQVAFNTGLHARQGDVPRWVVEGLAMLFEADARRDDGSSRNAADRLNRDRYIWFMNYRQSRRPRRSLSEFLTSDDLFQTAPLDAYSEAWALSFYLLEMRPSQYAAYLKAMAARNPLEPYSPAQRLADFQAAFNPDLDWLEGQYLLFHDRLNKK